jgi:hypothetical protein
MRFLGRWLSHSLTLGLALLFAIVAMQLPSFTHEYASTLLQVAQAARADIEQREASGRQFYGITADGDDAFVVALKGFEPSNAATLALALAKARGLQEAHDAIAELPALLQPLGALRDAWRDEHGDKAEISRTLLSTYSVQISFTLAAAVYGAAGLFLGAFLAELLSTLGRRLFLGADAARRGAA